jgi:hypothetical protein
MPFPNFIKGMGDTILLYNNATSNTTLYNVDESDWTVAAETTYDLYTPANSKAATAGSSWHFIDMHTGWIAMNGACILIKTQWVDGNKVFVVDTMTIQTGCSFRGRVLCGGFGSDFWDASGWSATWANWLSKSQGMGLAAVGTPGKNWVGWSSVGHADMPMMVLLHDEAISGQGITGAHSSKRPLFFDQARKNEMGMRPMDWQGTVWNMKSLSSGVMVYGEDGVSALIPAGEPFPTFGLKEEIHRIGIASRSAVGGDQHRHLFLDANGTAWMVLADFTLQRLGYETLLEPLVGEDITIHFDPNRKEFYISSEDDAFILSESGLSKVPYLITGGYNIDKGSGSSFHVIKDLTSTTVDTNKGTGIWQSELVRLDTTQTIQRVEVVGKDNASIAVKFEFRNDISESLMTSSSVSLDDRGVAHLPLSCTEFSLILTGTSSPINSVVVTIDDVRVVFSNGRKLSIKERVTN